jgi:hypothetical protein
MAGAREALANLARVTLISPEPSGRPSSVFPAGFAPKSSLSEGFDPEALEKRAEGILSQVGPSRLPLDLVFNSDDPAGKTDAEKLAEKFAAYHIPVRLAPLTGAHGKGILEKADWDILIGFRRPEFPSPEMWLGRFLDSRASVAGNPARFENRDADSYIQELNVVPPADRALILRRLAMLATQEKPYVMLYQKLIPMAVDPRLEKLRPHPMWPEAWPIEETNLDPFRNSTAAPTGPPVEVGPLIKGFDDPVAEPYE